MLLFVWLIIFITCDASSDSSDSGEGFFGGDFQADVFNINPFRFDGCPCNPNGAICDILAACDNAVVEAGEFEEGACFAIGVFGVIAGFCGPEIDRPDFFDFLFTPVFAATEPFFGPFGICASSPDGIAGIIRAFIGYIIDFIGELDDCFDDDRRRLQDGTTKPSQDPFHGSARTFERFVELLEWRGTDKEELYNLVMKEGGIAHLAGMMKVKASGMTAPSDTTDTTPADTTTRRLLSSDSGEDDFGICDFSFLDIFFGGIRRRLQGFPVDKYPFEALLSTLFTSADCDNNRGETPILCIVKEAMDGRGPNRRRLESDSSDSSDSSDDSGDGDDDRCCGERGTSIQITVGGQAAFCGREIGTAFECLDAFAAPENCDLESFP